MRGVVPRTEVLMRLIAVAVRDSAVDSFARPFFVPSLGLAIRSFGDEVRRVAPDNMMHAHPEDFELWYVGDWDESAGAFSVADPEGKRLLMRAKDVEVS